LMTVNAAGVGLAYLWERHRSDLCKLRRAR